MELVEYITNNASTFLFVLIRTGSMLMLAPVFGTPNVPLRIKTGLAIVLSLVLMSIVPPVEMPRDLIGLCLGIAGELLIGFTIGLTVRFVFAGFEFAGQVSGFQMGLGMANVYDPINSVQITVLGRLMSILSLLIFLSINGHLLVIAALKKSFETVPPYGTHLTGTLMQHILHISGNVFVTGVKIAAPVMATLLFLNTSLGIMARTVPQLNMFVIGFAVATIVGFLVMAMSMPFFQGAMVRLMHDMWWRVFRLLEVM